MKLTHSLSRRQALAMLGGATITVGFAACTKSTDTAVVPTVSDATGVIASNHGHTAIITKAQLTAGGGLTLDITGTSSHTHSLTLTAVEVTTIKGGTRVSKESTSGGSHTHTVTFN